MVLDESWTGEYVKEDLLFGRTNYENVPLVLSLVRICYKYLLNEQQLLTKSESVFNEDAIKGSLEGFWLFLHAMKYRVYLGFVLFFLNFRSLALWLSNL